MAVCAPSRGECLIDIAMLHSGPIGDISPAGTVRRAMLIFFPLRMNEWRAGLQGFLRIKNRIELLVLNLDQIESSGRGLERSRRNHSHRLTDIKDAIGC